MAFNDYGFDQLSLTAFVGKLNRQFALTLTPAIFSDYPTLCSFSEYLVKDYNEMIASQLQSSLPAVDNEMDAFLCRLLWCQLHSIGFFIEQRSLFTDLKAKIRNLYARWLDKSIAVLAERNYLHCDLESCTVPDSAPMDIEDEWRRWKQQQGSWTNDPAKRARMVLAETALRALPGILTGKKRATEILFPDSSLDLVEGIYKNNPVADYFNHVLADSVVAYIQDRIQKDSSTRIRILEIGAGTGGTSEAVFRKLEAHRDHIEEYLYTDISKAFLLHAEREYGPQWTCLRYGLFNVEKPIAEQDIRAGAYDVVIAANVLHATKNIRNTLRNAKAALRRNGLFLLNELSDSSLFNHLTFGLLEGWWLYDDAALRIPGCPGLTADSWKSVLESEGFRSIFFPAQTAHESGQQIIVAESDGVVRQKQKRNSDITRHNTHFLPPTGKKTVERSVALDPYPALQKEKWSQHGADVTDQMIEDHLRNVIRESIAETLKMEVDQIQDETSFSEYGIDSIIAGALINRINEYCPFNLPITALFDHNDVDRLIRYIMREHKPYLISTLQEDVPVPDPKIESSKQATPVDKDMDQPTDYPPNRRWQRNWFQTKHKASHPDSIAIIGMSGRFVKSKTVDQLWEHLAAGNDLIEKVTRWDLSEYYPDPQDNDRPYCNDGGFLDDIDKFDPSFFNISGIEANFMDPQQRIFLEEAWNALEDAGYAGEGVAGCRCGVYVGCSDGDYPQLFENNPPAQAFWGNAGSVIPARIAYYLDLQGPAVAVDTACSSSLTAIHFACQGLWTRETEMALAGGVFIQSTPGFIISANRAGMLSPTGWCHTFDERADGCVPGEGAGVVVLKLLKDAMADGDHIHGVIRGSGINQDGKTNGITAPSAISQERLERRVYDTFHIHPEQIQMVEAHGTGTKLGDPIEFAALTRAYRKDTDKEEFCAIGSIKTNIGHTVTAAGVAGIIKILLSLRHKQIPPSLNFQSANPNIQLKGSPFYVNTHLTDWEIDADSKRCAVISSFGFSGTNAHMAIEEAPETVRKQPNKPGYLIVLSARTSKQLIRQVEQISKVCETEFKAVIGDMSYTLLIGRKHFSHRLACVVRSRKELFRFLNKWLGTGKVSQIYVSSLDENDHREQPALKRYGNQCIRDCQKTGNPIEYLEFLSTIADLYVQGYALEFEQLFQTDRYFRISLPTYPFARESYWIPEAREHRAESSLSRRSFAKPEGHRPGNGVRVIHPLLHENTSDLSEQRFSSTFTGEEFFLSDHVVKGERVLPGAVYLEMARAAVLKAAGFSKNEQIGIRLKNVVWARPVAVGERPVQLHTGLYSKENGEIAFEIFSASEDIEVERIIHSQGSAFPGTAQEEPILDIDAIKSECNRRVLSSDHCYEMFKAMGISYGPGHRGIEKVYGNSEQVLAKLSLPASILDTENQFVLHPSLMDSALQAPIALMQAAFDADSTADQKPVLPFALEVLEILGSCTRKMWAFVRKNGGGMVQKFDIDLCDETGKVCVRMKGLSPRMLEDTAGPEYVSASSGTLLLKPIWKEKEASEQSTTPDYGRHLVMLCEFDDSIKSAVETRMPGVDCIRLNTKANDIANRYKTLAKKAFVEIRGIIGARPESDVLIQMVVPIEGEKQLFSGLSGLLKTASLEQPKIVGQLIVSEADADVIAERLNENRRRPKDREIRYQDGKRLVAEWKEISVSPEASGIPWKERGVYLITGGAGRLGMIFAKEIVEKVKGTALILIGRSELSKAIKERLKELESIGAKVEYKSVDVSDKKAIEVLVQEIQNNFGGLNGIIHSAGVIRDNFILKKTKAEFEQVLAPKVEGVINLDQATKELDLDFFVLFSSVAGAIGNAGQADYSTANAFMDAFAKVRNSLLSSKERSGQTLAINWPLWREGGMGVDEAIGKMLKESMGMVAMDTPTGIAAFYNGLASKESQAMVMEGNLIKMKNLLSGPKSSAELDLPMAGMVRMDSEAVQGDKINTKYDENEFKERVKEYLRKIISKVLKIPEINIKEESSFDRYGMDSILALNLIRELEKDLGTLVKTLFFEYENINELCEYFINNYRQKLLICTGKQSSIKTVKPLSFIQKRQGCRFSKTREKQDTDSLPTPQLIEKTKIKCARKFFDEINRKINPDHVTYDVLDSYGKLMELAGFANA